MATDLQTSLVALEGLLDAERHTIRNGGFAGLEELADEKTRLLDRIAAGLTRADAGQLARLKDKADSNQRLLSSALKGVRAAQQRLDTIRRASRSMTTYDNLGRAQTIGLGAGTVERRS